MVAPTFNRKRGKSREMRTRDAGRMHKSNRKALGKIKKPTVRDPRPGKKQLKKREQRARLQAKAAKDKGADTKGDKMVD